MSNNATPVISHRQPRVLACVLCQHRKIKCDRNTPCSNCIKANATCTPSTPAPARKRRRPNQDLQERLARCEELLKQYAGGSVPSQADLQAAAPSVASVTTPASTFKAETSDYSPTFDDFPDRRHPGKVIHQDGGVRFIDSQLWSTFYDELQAMREIVDADDPEGSSVLGTEGHTPENNADVLLLSDSSSANPEDYQPDPVQAFRLWQIFLDRVNPLTKIVHVPTLQPYVIEATSDSSGVPLNYQALLLSVYLLASIALQDSECMQLIGISRDQAVQRFTAGTKQALIKLDFLRNSDMASIQALVLFLYSLQGRYDRHAAWVLSGTIVRVAQKMGYHRDGELLGLTPFETEMRRRIWWQILMQDTKLAIVSGVIHNTIQDSYDTKPPRNLNDADLFPGSTEPVQPREGPTEMAFVLITNRLTKFMLSESSRMGFESAIMGHDPNNADEPQDPSIKAKYKAIIQELDRDLLDIEQRYCDPSAGNVHSAALTIRAMLIRKLDEMLVPMQEQPEWGTEIFEPKDNLVKLVLMNNEQSADAYDRMAPLGFLWFVKLHFQLEVFGVLTGQLARRPTGSLSDRGWRIVEKVHRWQPELFDVSVKAYASQAQFTLKAWKAREAAYTALGQAIEIPSFISRLRELVPTSDSRGSTQSCMTSPQMPPPQQTIHDLDQFLGGYLDVSSLSWDMWGDMTNTNTNNNNHQAQGAFFNGFALGSGMDGKSANPMQ
uniref:Zn(2)-C6 fungal-type domain-containing protein n=1 Tax=Bionectria ochroleuca TaxID=29856 RepID=A0A8H7NKJ5_BIOOC